MPENKKIQIGIIVDLSKSMRKPNVSIQNQLKQNDDYKKVLNRLQSELNRLKLFKQNQNTIKISILALGVHARYTSDWPNIKESYFGRRIENAIWDLFKISNLLNSFQTRLSGIEEKLKEKWNDFLKSIIEGYEKSLNKESESILYQIILKTITKRANIDFAFIMNRFLKFAISKKYFPEQNESAVRFINQRKENLRKLPEFYAQKFLDTAKNNVMSIFLLKRYIYQKEIDTKFRGFISENVKIIVRKSASSVQQDDLLNEFSLEKLNKLKDDISKYLYKEIKQEFGNRLYELDKVKKEINDSLGVIFFHWELRKELEDYVKFISFNELSALAETTIKKIFEETIKSEIKYSTIHNMECDKFPVFIDANNIDLSINDEQNTFFNYLEANKLIFHRSDYYQSVLNKYLNYFKENALPDTDNYIILISDGGVYESKVNQCEGFIYALKGLGIKFIMAATLAETMKAFPERNEINFNYSDQFLFKNASYIKDLPDSIAQILKKRNSSLTNSSKLLFSLNDEMSLEEILAAIVEEEK